ncbi:MAG: hypothetical protein ACI9O2_000400, partial [Flammeovirgaceae bacterium]
LFNLKLKLHTYHPAENRFVSSSEFSQRHSDEGICTKPGAGGQSEIYPRSLG